MEAFLTSIALVTLGEIGDKTQLLALMLAARYRRPWIIVLGILCATLLNHTLAGLVGGWVRTTLPPEMLRWILGGSFIVMGAWVLIPEKMDDPGKHERSTGGNKTAWPVFAITVSTFFLAEMGDKTQLATVGLAARFDSLAAVIAGTTFGMLLADGLAVWLGNKASAKLPLKLIRATAALFFVIIGLYVLCTGLPDAKTQESQAMQTELTAPISSGFNTRIKPSDSIKLSLYPEAGKTVLT